MSNQTVVPATPIHRLPTPSAPLSAAATPLESTIPFDTEQIRHDMKLCSDYVWDVDKLRPHQYKIGELLFNPNKSNAIIAVYPTRSGKSHAICVIGAMQRGIIMIFIPLLTLSADVMAKFASCKCLPESWIRLSISSRRAVRQQQDVVSGGVTALNRSQALYHFIEFLLLSPQHLCKDVSTRTAFIHCSWFLVWYS